MDKEKVEWACQLSHAEWQSLLKARNHYIVQQAKLDNQDEAKRRLLALVQAELRKEIAMTELSEMTQKSILNHAYAVAPNECCGFIVSDHMDGLLFYFPCRNVADDPENHFEISPEEFIEAEQLGNVVAVVHSHPEGEPKLSLADRQMQYHLQLDFWLVCEGKLHFFPKILPLVGREFEHGKTDCYTLFKDIYFLAGADFPEFERQSEWWEKGEDLYLDNLEQHDFKRLDSTETLQVGDLILMQVGSTVANHAAVYLGEQMVLHHSPKRLSKRDLYDGYWLKHTHSIWRYQEWSKLDFTVPLNSLGNLSV